MMGGLSMANIRRKLGINVFELMQKTGISLESFAEQMGYSIKDTWSIIEGRKFLPPRELERIAKCLGASKSELVNYQTNCKLPELQYMKEFSNPENLDKILDLMDEYVECRECV